MKTRILMLVAGLAFATAVHAQPSGELSGHKQAALDLLEMSRAEQNILDTIDLMLQVQLEQNPMMAQFEDILRDYISTHMAWSGMVDEYAQIYMEAFTEQELRDITAYYGTETGQKAARLMPTMMQQGAMIGQRKMMENEAELEERIMARFEELSAASGDDAFDGGMDVFQPTQMLEPDSTGAIFRSANLWPGGSIRLGQTISDVAPLVFRLSDGIYQVYPENFGEAQAITLFTDAEGRIREMRFDYDTSYVIDEMKGSFDTMLGRQAIYLEGADADRFYWEDGATRFELVFDKSLGAGSIYALIRNR